MAGQQQNMYVSGNPQQPQMAVSSQSAQPPGNPPAPQPSQQRDDDPIAKFKVLLPRLRDSLVNLFRHAGQLLYQNAQQDENGVQLDSVTMRFDKCLEEFYAICDQIEINLRLAHELVLQERDSSRNTPISITPSKSEPAQHADTGHLYSQYLSTARYQVSCAKDIRDVLHECLKTFTELSSHASHS